MGKLIQYLTVIALFAQPLPAVSVLSHEELVDLVWDSNLRPMLESRFPEASPEQIKRAHAFAYGGSVIQDVGYYPLGNQVFTNFLHYVRSGDFVLALIREARDINEYAFALGALGHYVADCWGHTAVNLSTPILYPKLARKYGDWVTYEDDHNAHRRTEFSFDVLEVAKNRYNSQQYHDFIGFDVSEDLLERAFLDTYGIPMDSLLRYDDLTLETFRFAVAKVIPEMTEVALATNKPKVSGERNDPARKAFLYRLSRVDYEKQFGNKYRRPGIFARLLGFLLKLIPLGPARILGYHNPSPQTEDYYFRSMDKAFDEYRALLAQVKKGDLDLANRNLDTGEVCRESAYRLADQSYASWAIRLAKDGFQHITPAARVNVLAYFSRGAPSNRSIADQEWKRVEASLATLRAQPASADSIPAPSR